MLIAKVSCIGTQVVGVDGPLASGVESEALGTKRCINRSTDGTGVAYINSPEVRREGDAIRLSESVLDHVDSTRRRTEAIYCGLELRSRICFRTEPSVVFSVSALEICQDMFR